MERESVGMRLPGSEVVELRTRELLDEVVVILHGSVDDDVWLIHLPSPLGPNWVGVMSGKERGVKLPYRGGLGIAYLQQKTHLLAQASDGVVSMHRWLAIPV
jgi:hypothetical protein